MAGGVAGKPRTLWRVAVLTLILLVAWLFVVSAVPVVRLRRATGHIPLPTPSARASAAWWAKLLGSAALLLAFGAPVAELLGLRPLAPLGDQRIRTAGIALVVLGTAGALVAQRAMGAAWRPDVSPAERLPLVTNGPFRLVRNPVLAATLVAELGFFLLVPNLVGLAFLAASFASAQVQVRLVEEPHLARVHGAEYASYAARTGRFVPGLGRLRQG
jgi:protein-S-isoprenylcysteine O-methyltransferase Ste14